MVSEEFKKELSGDKVSGYRKIKEKLDKGVEKGFKTATDAEKKLYKKYASKKMRSRKIMKKGKMVVHVPAYQAPSILGDENRFFTGELNQEKKRLFFS